MHPVVKLSVIGATNAGKTSLLRCLGNVPFRETRSPTIGVDWYSCSTLHVLNPKEHASARLSSSSTTKRSRREYHDSNGSSSIETPISLQVWDVAGDERYLDLSRNYYQNVSGIVIAVDCADFTPDAINAWLDRIAQHANADIDLGIFIIFTKTDLLNEDDTDEDNDDEDKKISDSIFNPVLFNDDAVAAVKQENKETDDGVDDGSTSTYNWLHDMTSHSEPRDKDVPSTTAATIELQPSRKKLWSTGDGRNSNSNSSDNHNDIRTAGTTSASNNFTAAVASPPTTTISRTKTQLSSNALEPSIYANAQPIFKELSPLLPNAGSKHMRNLRLKIDNYLWQYREGYISHLNTATVTSSAIRIKNDNRSSSSSSSSMSSSYASVSSYSPPPYFASSWSESARMSSYQLSQSNKDDDDNTNNNNGGHHSSGDEIHTLHGNRSTNNFGRLLEIDGVFFVSSKTGTNVHSTFQTIASLLINRAPGSRNVFSSPANTSKHTATSPSARPTMLRDERGTYAICPDEVVASVCCCAIL